MNVVLVVGGYVAGILTIVVAFVIGERFRAIESQRSANDVYEQIEAVYKKWEEGTLTDQDFQLPYTKNTAGWPGYAESTTRGLNKTLFDNAQELLDEIATLKEEKKNLLSGHFCPSPQLAKLASICDCAHSDKHRKDDWATIDRLTAALEKIAKNKDATEYYDELITGGFAPMSSVAKHLINQIGREADDALKYRKQNKKTGPEEAGVEGRAAEMVRAWSFEGRCEVCSKSLSLKLKRISNRGIQINAFECAEHPGKSHILWPQRDDIVVVTEPANKEIADEH